MWSIASLSFSASTLVGISFLVLIDLTIRFVVFHRFESVALDVSLFSFAYSVIELSHRLAAPDSHGLNNSETMKWALRAGAGLFFLLVIMIVHSNLDERLKNIVEEIIKTNTLSGKSLRAIAMTTASPLIFRSILLTFSGPEVPKIIREGKKNWRKDAVDFINGVNGLEGVKQVAQENFLLPRPYRFSAAAFFFFSGAASLIAPTVTFTFHH